MKTICTALANAVIASYEKCDKERRSMVVFRLSGTSHVQSSCYINVDHQGMCSSDSTSPQQLWLEMTRSIPHEVHNPLMIDITSVVYGYILEQARLWANASSEERDVSLITYEPDEVYLRFGGGTLVDLFNIWYNRNLKFLNKCEWLTSHCCLLPLHTEIEEECISPTEFSYQSSRA